MGICRSSTYASRSIVDLYPSTHCLLCLLVRLSLLNYPHCCPGTDTSKQYPWLSDSYLLVSSCLLLVSLLQTVRGSPSFSIIWTNLYIHSPKQPSRTMNLNNLQFHNIIIHSVSQNIK